MNAVAFDTLKFARRLEQAGFTRDQADGAAEALAETFSEQIATRGDVADLRGEISGLRVELKGDVASLRAEVKTDVSSLKAELKTDIASFRASTAQWIISAVFLNALTVIGAVAAVWQLARR